MPMTTQIVVAFGLGDGGSLQLSPSASGPSRGHCRCCPAVAQRGSPCCGEEPRRSCRGTLRLLVRAARRSREGRLLTYV